MEDTTPVTLPDPTLVKVFPRRWLSGAMMTDEVRQRVDARMLSGPPPTQAVMGLGWRAARTARFIGSCTRHLPQPESWRPNPRCWIMAMHRTDMPSADVPLGFIGFRPEVEYDPAGGPALQFRLNLDLVWVAPTVRQLGYGYHLAAHVHRYLEAHPLPASDFGNTIRGLEVAIVRSDLGTCRRVASMIANFFEVRRMSTSKEQAFPGRPLPAWPVLDVDLRPED